MTFVLCCVSEYRQTYIFYKFQTFLNNDSKKKKKLEIFECQVYSAIDLKPRLFVGQRTGPLKEYSIIRERVWKFLEEISIIYSE